MRGPFNATAWARVAVLAMLALSITACVSDYRYVRPDGAGSGGYYTSSEPYSGTGYYDYYGTGPYYSGTSGWGYYNGSPPYAWAYGGYGGYNGWGYWPGINLGFGVSSVWNFPGYWGPWYSSYPPIWWGCRHRRCAHYRTNQRGAENAQYLGVMSLRPSLPTSGAPSPQTSRSVALPQDFGVRGADHWLRDRTAIERERFVRAPAAVRERRALRPSAALTAPGYAPRPLASPPQALSPAEFARPRNNGYRTSPRTAPRPSFQPRARAPEAVAPLRPHDNHSPDSRRH